MKAIYLPLGEMPGLLKKLHRDAAFEWETPMLALAGFITAASTDSRYHTVQQSLLIQDVSDALANGHKQKVEVLMQSHTFCLTMDVLQISDGTVYTAAVRVLHIAGRILECYEHLDRYVQAEAEEKSAELVETDQPYLDELVPSLKQWFDPTTIDTMEWCLEKIGSLLSTVKKSDGAFDTFQLGVRGYAVCKAFDFHDERETETAKQLALYHAWHVGQVGRDYLTKVLSLVQEKTGKIFPGLSQIPNCVWEIMIKKGSDFKKL
jgi:hypothetical protein